MLEKWTRREFVRGAAGAIALQHWRPRATTARFAYVASGADSIHVFRVQGEQWTDLQHIASPSPACILVSRDTLYAANDVGEYGGLPRGSVEAFRIGGDGRLSLLGRTALSLSATHPRHMALSPDGKLLAVAAYEGGIYNLFAIAADGSLGQPCGIFKDTGCGANPESQASAHPHTLLFDAARGYLLASDFGSDRLSVFAVENGRLTRRMQRAAGEGSGPGACVVHPAGSFLYVCHGLEGMLASYPYKGGAVGDAVQRIYLASSDQALAMHPSGRMLYTTRPRLRAWRIDAESGMLSATSGGLGEATQTAIASDGGSLFVLDALSGSISTVTVEPATGEPLHQAKTAWVNQPRSMALKETW